MARERILRSLQQALRGGEQRLAAELRAAGPMTIAKFLEHTGRTLDQIYDAGGMTHLRRLAGHLPPADDAALNRRFERLLHIDDPARLAVLRSPHAAAPLEQLMLGYQLFHESADLFRPADWLPRLGPDLLVELGELADALSPQAHAVETDRIDREWPLHFHRRYSRREVQTACGHMTPQRKPSHREGPLRLSDIKTELLFVTLNKREGGFSETTSYEDYAISRDLFHWESQSTRGRTETREDAFVALGPVRYVSHTGERPMGITWRIEMPLPAALLERFAALLAA